MTPLSARLSVIALCALFIATAVNALLFQDGAGPMKRGRDVSTASVSFSQMTVPQGKTITQPAPPIQSGTAKPEARDAVAKPQDASQRLILSIQRELGRKGYAYGASDPGQSLPANIIAYEFDMGLDLSGQMSDALLKRLIFDAKTAPRGLLADRAERDGPLILAVQKTLLELGFFSGVLSGQMDDWTSNAVKAFERHRGLPLSGRLNEAVLYAVVTYSGQPLARLAAR